MEPLLQLEGLRIGFRPGREVVHGATFDLPAGQIVGVVGESGSGKSLTALALLGLTPPGAVISGHIRYRRRDGLVADLAGLSDHAIRPYRGREIAMIFQEPMTSLNPVLTCGAQVAEAVRLHQGLRAAAVKTEVLRWFDEVRLPRAAAMYDAWPHQISGGQKQRVMIAAALACRPALLVADEPTTALDVTVQQSILELLLDLRARQGLSILFITHDLGVVADIADRVVVLYRGDVLEQGATRAVFAAPQHPYTRSLLACRPPLNVSLSRLPVVSDFMTTTEAGEYVPTGRTVAQALAEHHWPMEAQQARSEALQAQQPILKVERLKVWFPIEKGLFGRAKDYVRAVDDVSFVVHPGETVGLVGESGCGKTTLGRALVRLADPTSGRIWFQNEDWGALQGEALRKARRHIQMVFQDPFGSLNPKMTVGAMLTEPMAVHHIGTSATDRKRRALELLARVGLETGHFDRYPHEFSGGQRQRVCIARALTVEPRFLVCDESVSALDVSVQAQILNLLRDLRDELGLTYLFISHDMSVIRFISDRVLVMQDGRIVEEGATAEIFERPQHPYTQTLLAAVPGQMA